jgi:3D (Asp-Asp-Asp) domain-containing protein
VKKLKIERLVFLVCLIICFIALIISGFEVEALEESIKELEYQNKSQVAQLKDKDLQIQIQDMLLNMQDDIISNYIVEDQSYKEINAGDYTVTAYCGCEVCCGEWALNRPNGIVYGAAGIELQEGVSVASPLPFGTRLLINDQEYIVQDRTAQWIEEKYDDKIIDIYFDNHFDAEAFGKQIADVYILEDSYGKSI